MKILRFIFPFLFVRNWYDGAWELSRARCILFLIFVMLMMVAVGIAGMLQSPIEYSKP